MALNIKSWFIFKIVITYTVVATGLIVNFFQLLTYLLVRPFNKILYKRLNYYLGYALFAQMTAYASYWSGFELEVFCTEEDFKHLGKENSFGVPNHHYDLDWLTGWVFFERIGQLGGAKVVLKNNLKYIPVMGWAWIFCEYIFVKRVWDKDQKTLIRDLKEILEYPKDLNFAINIFCESTRFTPEKHEACLEIAKQKGLPLLKHHLLPRPKGFALVSSQLAGKVDYLYDLEIGVKKIVDEENSGLRDPTIMDMQHGVPIHAQILVRRIPMSTVPAGDEKKCAAYLNKLYQEKDEAYAVFDKHGDFSPLGYKKHVMKRTRSELICALSSVLFVLLPSIYYFVWMVLNGSLLTNAIILTLILAMILTTKLAISKSNTKSSFGLKKTTTDLSIDKKTDLNNNSVVVGEKKEEIEEESSAKKID